MLDIPWNAPARLFDRYTDKRYAGTLKSAVQRWMRMPRDAQALAMITFESVSTGVTSLLAADIRELLAGTPVPAR